MISRTHTDLAISFDNPKFWPPNHEHELSAPSLALPSQSDLLSSSYADGFAFSFLCSYYLYSSVLDPLCTLQISRGGPREQTHSGKIEELGDEARFCDPRGDVDNSEAKLGRAIGGRVGVEPQLAVRWGWQSTHQGLALRETKRKKKIVRSRQ
jgi:hypothetical protein